MKKKVLLVEDEKHLIGKVKKGFERRGFDILATHSVEEALAFLESLEKLSIVFIEKDRKILVIEDDENLLEVIKGKLESSGFSVLTARSAEEGLACLDKTDNIVAVWLDHYLLGRKTGLDFMAKLRKRSQGERTPIFVVSNLESSAKRNLYNVFGISKYYPKAEYRLDEIVKDIKKFLAEQKVA